MKWLPLESNPDVMNKYMQGLGLPADEVFTDLYDLSEAGLKLVKRPVRAVILLFPLKYMFTLGLPSSWEFSDVFGLDTDLLAIVPKPVVAVSLLYPLTQKTGAYEIGEPAKEHSLFYSKQTISNACGTMCLLHAVLNNLDTIQLDSTKHLIKFYEATKDLSPAEKAKYLESDEAFSVAHGESALEGQTQAREDEEVKGHFIAFVHHNGGLYELDGRKDGPTFHGPTTPETLLEDTAVVIKKFMERDPEEVNFTVVALSKACT